MPKLWQKTRDTKDTADLEEVDLSTLRIASPSIVFISGRETTDKNLEEVSKSIHYLKKILPGAPQIYSWSHSRQLSRLYNTLAYHQFPQYNYRPSSKKLAKGVIMPLVSEDGKPLPYEEAQKRLRNLTLFGYSAGSIVAQEVFNASLKMMKKIGYTPEDARRLLHEVVLINIGTVSRPTKETDRFTTISYANSDDWFVSAKNLAHNPVTHILFGAQQRKLKVRQLSGTSLLVTAAARKMILEPDKEIIDGVKLPRWKLMASNHEVRDYINTDDAQSQLSRIVLYSLTNAISRQGTPDPHKLLEPPADLPADEKALYEKKIAKASEIAKGLNPLKAILK